MYRYLILRVQMLQMMSVEHIVVYFSSMSFTMYSISATVGWYLDHHLVITSRTDIIYHCNNVLSR